MEDGPEAAEGHYDYAGKTYRLVEEESERWNVFADGVYLGVLAAADGERQGPLYTFDLAGEEGGRDEPATDDWRRGLETLIDVAQGGV